MNNNNSKRKGKSLKKKNQGQYLWRQSCLTSQTNEGTWLHWVLKFTLTPLLHGLDAEPNILHSLRPCHIKSNSDCSSHDKEKNPKTKGMCVGEPLKQRE